MSLCLVPIAFLAPWITLQGPNESSSLKRKEVIRLHGTSTPILKVHVDKAGAVRCTGRLDEQIYPEPGLTAPQPELLGGKSSIQDDLHPIDPDLRTQLELALTAEGLAAVDVPAQWSDADLSFEELMVHPLNALESFLVESKDDGWSYVDAANERLRIDLPASLGTRVDQLLGIYPVGFPQNEFEFAPGSSTTFLTTEKTPDGVERLWARTADGRGAMLWNGEYESITVDSRSGWVLRSSSRGSELIPITTIPVDPEVLYATPPSGDLRPRSFTTVRKAPETVRIARGGRVRSLPYERGVESLVLVALHDEMHVHSLTKVINGALPPPKRIVTAGVAKAECRLGPLGELLAIVTNGSIQLVDLSRPSVPLAVLPMRLEDRAAGFEFRSVTGVWTKDCTSLFVGRSLVHERPSRTHPTGRAKLAVDHLRIDSDGSISWSLGTPWDSIDWNGRSPVLTQRTDDPWSVVAHSRDVCSIVTQEKSPK